MIVVAAERTTPSFTRVFTTASDAIPGLVLPQIELELCALYLHLLDRDVYLAEGQAIRDAFADSLFDALAQKIADKFGIQGGAFAEFCNGRQIEYSRFKEVFCVVIQLRGF